MVQAGVAGVDQLMQEEHTSVEGAAEKTGSTELTGNTAAMAPVASAGKPVRCRAPFVM